MNDFVSTLHATKCAKRSDGALKAVASQLQVDEMVLGAFIDVEAGAVGYDMNGTVKILFERFHFYKNLGPTEKRAVAVDKGLAFSHWVRPPKGYSDQQTSTQRWGLLDRAADIDETMALMSASWGLGQIMGEHALQLSYPSVQNFTLQMATSEDNQLDAMGRFVERNHLDAAMRAKDWLDLAEGYNGAGQAVVYASKLEAAYRRRVVQKAKK